ncbi:MAG: DUF1573 domain-containing protein [Desulfobacterales bacterium]|nr:DUF1573 domain-containing protein [Desulfobacterales bacterium]
MAQFDRAIPPGGEGKITLKVDTKGYEGNVRKSARIYSNDPTNRIQTIRLEGFIRRPISLSQKTVFLQGVSSQVITKTVKIRGGLDKPLQIEPVQFTLDQWLAYKIEEVQPGKLYQVHFTTIPGNYHYYQGLLKLKTNYPERPEIDIQIRGRFSNASPPGPSK